MTHACYRAILALHPRAFRMRYGEEMLAIFEACEECPELFTDALRSLARQWLKSPEAWTAVGAVIGGLIPFVMAIRCLAS